MKTTDYSDQLLRCLVQIIGRAAMPPEKVFELVGRGEKLSEAFNLCDGSLSQNEICKKTGIDAGNLSRTFTKWIENGIAFSIGEGKSAKLLHIYPLPASAKVKPKKNKKR